MYFNRYLHELCTNWSAVQTGNTKLWHSSFSLQTVHSPHTWLTYFPQILTDEQSSSGLSFISGMSSFQAEFKNHDFWGMSKSLFLMVYWWWWVQTYPKKWTTQRSLFLWLMIGGAILLSASKIFACIKVKHVKEKTPCEVQLCIKNPHHEMFRIFPEIFQNCLDHKKE